MLPKPNVVHPMTIEEETQETTESQTEPEALKITDGTDTEDVPSKPAAEDDEKHEHEESEPSEHEERDTIAVQQVRPEEPEEPDLSDDAGDTDATVIEANPGPRTAPEGADGAEPTTKEITDTETISKSVPESTTADNGPPLPKDDGMDLLGLIPSVDTNLPLPGQIPMDDVCQLPRSRASSAGSIYKQPPTLDALIGVDHLLVKQINKDKEDFANVPNNYDIVAKGTGKIYIGKEETHPEVRAKVQTSTSISQPFRMSIYDVSTGQEVLRIDRNGVNEAPTLVVQKHGRHLEERLGVIHFESGWLMLTPTYTIQDPAGKVVLRITGPPSGRLCHSIRYVTSTFDIFDPDGVRRVAKITKDGDFYVDVKDKAEAITREENLYIDYEEEGMDEKTKALILGTTFMLDYTYYKEPSFLTKLASFCCVVLPCFRGRSK